MKNVARASALILALVAGVAHADVWDYQYNRVGGIIQLTSAECPGTGHKGAAYITDADGTLSQHGCWSVSEPNVIVEWDDGNTMYYAINSWIVTEAGRKIGK